MGGWSDEGLFDKKGPHAGKQDHTVLLLYFKCVFSQYFALVSSINLVIALESSAQDLLFIVLEVRVQSSALYSNKVLSH